MVRMKPGVKINFEAIEGIKPREEERNRLSIWGGTGQSLSRMNGYSVQGQTRGGGILVYGFQQREFSEKRKQG